MPITDRVSMKFENVERRTARAGRGISNFLRDSMPSSMDELKQVLAVTRDGDCSSGSNESLFGQVAKPVEERGVAGDSGRKTAGDRGSDSLQRHTLEGALSDSGNERCDMGNSDHQRTPEAERQSELQKGAVRDIFAHIKNGDMADAVASCEAVLEHKSEDSVKEQECLAEVKKALESASESIAEVNKALSESNAECGPEVDKEYTGNIVRTSNANQKIASQANPTEAGRKFQFGS